MTHDRPESPSGTDPGQPLRVLGWPGFTSENGNPYTRLLYEAMETEANVEVDGFTMFEPFQRRYDVWHVHWPEDFLSYPSPVAAYFYIIAELLLFAWARLGGTKIVWTVHDLGPHESYHPQLESIFWPFFLPMVDGIISLSETAREEAISQFPALGSLPSAVVRHGHYRSAYPDPVPQTDARAPLDLSESARVALFFGRIRPYKNVPRLIEVFQQWADPDARLFVAGNPSEEALETTIAERATGDARVATELRFVEEHEVPGIFGASDLVVLPYDDIMHSGSALLALSFDRPVLVPDRGAMSELQAHVGADWVRTYNGALTVETLADAMGWVESQDRSVQAPLDDLSWAPLARETVDLYRRVLHS